jgi:hypothetical protein
MIPQEELDRALRRWKARKLGHDSPGTADGNHDAAAVASDDPHAPAHDEPTRVAAAHYHSEVETPPAEVQLGDEDFEDHTHRR